MIIDCNAQIITLSSAVSARAHYSLSSRCVLWLWWCFKQATLVLCVIVRARDRQWIFICVCVCIVFADVSRTHGRRLVVSDARQHHHQRLDRSNSESVERRDGGVYSHAVRTHVHRALHAPARKKVYMYTHTLFLYLLPLTSCSFTAFRLNWD